MCHRHGLHLAKGSTERLPRAYLQQARPSSRVKLYLPPRRWAKTASNFHKRYNIARRPNTRPKRSRTAQSAPKVGSQARLRRYNNGKRSIRLIEEGMPNTHNRTGLRLRKGVMWETFTHNDRSKQLQTPIRPRSGGTRHAQVPNKEGKAQGHQAPKPKAGNPTKLHPVQETQPSQTKAALGI